jgi:hypothetical protein
MSVETRTATARRQGELVTISIGPLPQSLDDARENLAACVTLTEGRRCPLLVDLKQALPLEPEVRHLYSGESLVASFTAIAMVISAAPLGRMMGNVYLRVARPGVPTRLFSRRAPAVDWLGQHVGP